MISQEPPILPQKTHLEFQESLFLPFLHPITHLGFLRENFHHLKEHSLRPSPSVFLLKSVKSNNFLIEIIIQVLRLYELVFMINVLLLQFQRNVHIETMIIKYIFLFVYKHKNYSLICHANA